MWDDELGQALPWRRHANPDSNPDVNPDSNHVCNIQAIPRINESLGDGGAALKSQLEAVGMEPVLISLCLKMLNIDPSRRILALDALRELGLGVDLDTPLPLPKADPPGQYSWTVGDMSLEGEPLKELLTLRRSFDTTLTVDGVRACFDRLATLHPLVAVRKNRSSISMP